MRARTKSRTVDLGARLAGLREAVAALDRVGVEGLGPDAPLRHAHAVLEHVGQRRELSAEHTVVALAGATGSGKSLLFNALSGTTAARVGVRRPTTSDPLAVVWGPAADAAALLDWLKVDQRHEVESGWGGRNLGGLVLLDLPDVDSVIIGHHRRAARLAETVDVLVWVLDPQKYADAVVHQEYLRPMSRHADVTVVVLNQADLLPQPERAAVLADLSERVDQDGLRGARVLAASAMTGDGVPELRSIIGDFVADRRAADTRLVADIATVADELGAAYRADVGGELTAPDRRRLVTTLARAAGVDLVAGAVAGSFRHRARANTGWPLSRWLGRLRPDPLRRLHLDRPSDPCASGPVVAASSIPDASPVQRAQVATALRNVGDAAAAGSGEPWRSYIRGGATQHSQRLPDALDQAVVSTELEGRTDPGWFRAVGVLQWLVFTVLAAGALWLGVVALLGYLRVPVPWVPQIGPVLPDPPLPELPAVPWPTALLIVGGILGLLISLTSAIAARVGANRRARRTRSALMRAIEEAAGRLVLDPVRERTADARSFAAGIRAAGGGRAGG